MKRFVLFSLLTALVTTTSAQEKPMDAPELTIREKPLASIQQVGADVSLATNLQSLPGVTVLPQGLPGGQSDLSIRGSTFSGAGISIAGLALRNAQTEHFHAELPFPGTWLGSPEVLTGVRQAATTEGHLTGTVSLTLLPIRPGTRSTAGADNKDGAWANASGQQVIADKSGAQTGVGAFAGLLNIPGVDLPDNDIDSKRGGLQLQRLDDHGQTDFWVGHQDKTFGARGYYGVNPAFDAEERTRDTLALAAWKNTDPSAPLDASFAYREFDDDYKLFLPSGLFRNEHTTRTLAGQFGGESPVAETLGLRYRFAADHEDIDSNSLGDFERSRLAATLLPLWSATPRLKLMAGARGEVLEGDDDRLLPLLRSEYQASDTILFHAEFSQSLRRPSYTELNYESPGSLGNSGLKLQDQDAYELGFRWNPAAGTQVDATLFRHQTGNTVDWVRPDAAAPRWLAENIGTVDTLGSELSLSQQLSPTLRVGASWLWLDKDAHDAPYSSRYALDYARHYTQANVDWTPLPWLRVEASHLWRDQVENALRDDGGDEQSFALLALHVRVAAHAQISLMAHNLFDDDYRIYPGQDTVTGRRISAALTLDW
jgi:iron complex outermembrane receptor protein